MNHSCEPMVMPSLEFELWSIQVTCTGIHVDAHENYFQYIAMSHTLIRKLSVIPDLDS